MKIMNNIMNRKDRSGGGVAVIYRDELKFTPSKLYKAFCSFEYLLGRFSDGTDILNTCVLYRTPGKNAQPMSVFFDEFSELLDHLILTPGKLMVLGDFNIQMDDVNNQDCQSMNVILNIYSLKQHVVGSTHESSHTLDLIITRMEDDIIVSNPILDHFISNHVTIETVGALEKRDVE